MVNESMDRGIEERLPLSAPVYHVLLALAGDTLHGYAIMQRFEALTGGAEQLLPGTLYATLARMVDGGLLVESDAPDDESDARRRYYRTTELGRAVARAESERLHRLLRVAEAQRILPGGATR